MNIHSIPQLLALTPILSLFFCSAVFPSNTSNIFVRQVYQEPQNAYEDPQNFVEFIIDQRIYQSASIGEWKWITQSYQLDAVALHPESLSGHVGLCVKPIVVGEGEKPVTALTRELIEQHLKLIQSSTLPYEGDFPDLKEPVSSVELDLTKQEGSDKLKCRFRFSIVQNELWIFVCESSEKNFPSFQQAFSTLVATFNRNSEKPVTPIAAADPEKS